MKPILALVTVALLLPGLVSKGDNLRSAGSRPQLVGASRDRSTADLLAAEREFWEAWKNKQPDRFASAMADDAVFFGLYGTTGKAESVNEQRDSVNSCQVASYALTNPRAILIDASAAILLYDAEQHAV